MHVFRRMMIIQAILVISILSSCSGTAFWVKPTPKPLGSSITKWLTNPTCQPPCWENLVPGETNIIDSVKVIGQIPSVTITGFPYDDKPWGIRQVRWQFTDRDEGGSATTEKNNPVISTIFLQVSGQQFLPVKQIVSNYGPPIGVLIYSCLNEVGNNGCVLHLIYNGFAIELRKLPDKGIESYQIKLSEDSKVSGIWFFPKGDNGYANTLGKNSGHYPKDLYQWKGFVDYP